MIRKIMAAALAMSTAAFLPSTVLADPVIKMNGVDITGVTNQKFTDVTIEFDAAGNIAITAPQYKIMAQDNKPADPASTRLVEPSPQAKPEPAPAPEFGNTLPDATSPTWLIATFNYPGLFGYNVNVYINNVPVTTIQQGQPKVYINVSAFLRKGLNTIDYRLDMAADSGTASKATVTLYFAKEHTRQGQAVEVTGQYAPVLIKRADGNKPYSVDLIVP